MSDDAQRKYNPTDGLMQLKGKAYLPVAERIVWFRQDYPEGQITTTVYELDRAQGFAMYHARVTTGQGGIAEASGSETVKDFGDYIEKAETKAVGRALGYLGYGTASAGFEEGGRAVDAPITPKRPSAAPAPAERAQQAPQPAPVEKRYTSGEYERFIGAAWEMRREGKPYEDVVAHLRQFREYLTPDQFTDAKEELQRIKAWTPDGVIA